MCYSPKQFLPYGPLSRFLTHFFLIRQVAKFYHSSDVERRASVRACVRAVVVLGEEAGQ